MSGYFMSARGVEPVIHERGVALVTILLIVALLTVIVSRVGLSGQIWVRQVDNGNALVQADLATRAAQAWIPSILMQDDNAQDGLTDIWAQPLPPLPFGHGLLFGRIDDMQARFNLNNLVDAEGNIDAGAMLRFERLLQILELHPGIAQAVADWIDVDGSPAGVWGAEDVYYLGLETPYLSANRQFEDTAELRLVRGIDTAAWQKLQAHVSALPGFVPVNVNTAGVEVLAATIVEWGSGPEAMMQAQKWVAQAGTQPVADIRNFVERMFAEGEQPDGDSLSVVSSYFGAYTQLNFGQVEYRMSGLYRRDAGHAVLLRHNREIM